MRGQYKGPGGDERPGLTGAYGARYVVFPGRAEALNEYGST